jgi:uroporphyrinogen-III synthase
MNTADSGAGEATSIFLLKTKSAPSDGYEQQFKSAKDGVKFEPVFVPVLEHKFKEKGMRVMRNLIRHDRFGTHDGAKYGGLIFTSQRAVEAFARVVADTVEVGDGAHPNDESPWGAQQISDCAFTADGLWPHIQDVPVYSVGPATTRGLRAIQVPALQIYGSETGNGEALAHFILDHYVDWHRDSNDRPPLLFLVGEQRRDIIPNTLMDPRLGMDRRLRVDEAVVYETGVMESFEQDFTELLRKTENRPSRWVVVFSPTGCEAMLRALNMLDPDTGRVRADISRSRRSTYIATIGPTTRDHLRDAFGFDPDVCSEQPTPKSVEAGIRKFVKEHRQQRYL